MSDLQDKTMQSQKFNLFLHIILWIVHYYNHQNKITYNEAYWICEQTQLMQYFQPSWITHATLHDQLYNKGRV
jgi:hypothetical protein